MVTEVIRYFDFDYIFIDAIFLGFWLLITLKNKQYSALAAGCILAGLVFIIDAVFWWNISAGPNFPGSNIREYWIGGQKVPNGPSELSVAKFAADFMMTISYGLFAFTWLWIMFQSWEHKHWKNIAKFSTLLLGSWLLIPVISNNVQWNDIPVISIRHMESQFYLQITVVVIGYLLMTILYGTTWFKSYDPKVIGFIFIVGCFQAFAMEFPLWLFDIRPSGIKLLLYEVVILTNQGTPYLYIIWNKILPAIKVKLTKSKAYTHIWPYLQEISSKFDQLIPWEKIENVNSLFHKLTDYSSFKSQLKHISDSIKGDMEGKINIWRKGIENSIHWERIVKFARKVKKQVKWKKLVHHYTEMTEKIKFKLNSLKLSYLILIHISKLKPAQLKEATKNDVFLTSGIAELQG